MPFTFSHVAAVLPLLRRHPARWSATGLVAGSLAPDFEKFLRLGAHNGHSHTWVSLLYFSCPMALVLAGVFHGVVRRPLIACLPGWLHRRMCRYQRVAWGQLLRRRFGWVLLSVVVGGATHLVWDSFTHRSGELVVLLPGLRAVWHIGGLWAPAFVFINALSSLLGLALTLLAIAQLPALDRPRAPVVARGLYWLLAAMVAAGLLTARLLLAGPGLKNIDVIISAVAGGLAGVAVASACFLPLLPRWSVMVGRVPVEVRR